MKRKRRVIDDYDRRRTQLLRLLFHPDSSNGVPFLPLFSTVAKEVRMIIAIAQEFRDINPASKYNLAAEEIGLDPNEFKEMLADIVREEADRNERVQRYRVPVSKGPAPTSGSEGATVH